MGRKGISYDKKLEAVEKYKRGEGNRVSIAPEYGIKQASFQQWIANYEAMDPSGLAAVHTNNKYSRELKIAAVTIKLK
jgi:transposase